ncbi:MAG: BREX system ATP-binding domain-containing protein [Dehalococcoidia bacterium]
MESRRAIEALRAGVPNQDAVQALGSSQSDLEKKFREQLKAVQDNFTQGKQSLGTLIAGDFGSGKSHLLEYFKHIALAENFVCSKIVISKETPLYNPAKVYRAAIEAATVPGRRGAALTEIATRLNFKSPAYSEFYKWVQSTNIGISSRFEAAVYLYEYAKGDDEIRDRIIRFWSGDPINVSQFKKYLKDMGEGASYKIDKVSAGELALQRYLFTPHLMVAAGYSGWVLLVDEVELVGRYSLKQRARSYAELARLMGKLEGLNLPGLTCIFAISADFESAVLEYRNDEEKIPAKFQADGDSLFASQAERGMQLIRRDKTPLDKLNTAMILDTFEKVRSVYATAYGWEPPAEHAPPDNTARIRQHVKRWITEWDLRRLYPDYKPEIETSELKQDLSEMQNLEPPNEESSEERQAPAESGE